MNEDLEQLVTDINKNTSSNDTLHQIIVILQQQTDALTPQFLLNSFQSLLQLESWAWELLSENSPQWLHRSYYQEFFHTLASLNKNIIFHVDSIDVDRKATLLFPVSVDQINCILHYIENKTDEHDPFLTIVSLWFDNHSHFLHENPHYQKLSITDPLNQYIARNFIMSKEFKFYLTQLRNSPVSKSIFTPKMLFYTKTCLCSLFSYLGMKRHQCPYSANGILLYLIDDYLQIIQSHYHSVASWSKDLLACIGHLMGVIAKCYWYDEKNGTLMKILFPTEQMLCVHIEQLIRILSYQPFQNKIQAVRSNDETVLIDSILMILMNIVQIENINWFFRSNSTIQNTLLTVAKTSLYDENCLRAYTILGEVLADEQLKQLNITETMTEYLFNMLEQAWLHPSKEYKQIPMKYLLKDFQVLSTNDSIQQTTADLNQIPFLIDMSDQYSIVYHIFWALSFNHDVQEQLRSSSLFMTKLRCLAAESSEKEMRKIVHGILWNLEGEGDNRDKTNLPKEKTFDVMISYSHKDKELCKQIYQELVKAGYRVWIDFDQLHGNIMEAMAQAIESSQTVIICMSEDYRKSNYCRAEAYYAFQRQRRIIPVLVQKLYKPDGWLLFLISQALYVDFTRYEFQRAMDMLLKELKTEMTSELDIVPVRSLEDADAVQVSRAASVAPTRSPNILEWTQFHVQDWLSEQNLTQLRHLFTECDGQSLVNLIKYMKYGNLGRILNSLEEDSLRQTNQSISYLELARFESLMAAYYSNDH